MHFFPVSVQVCTLLLSLDQRQLGIAPFDKKLADIIFHELVALFSQCATAGSIHPRFEEKEFFMEMVEAGALS